MVIITMMVMIIEELIVAGKKLAREGDGGYIKALAVRLVLLFSSLYTSRFSQFFCISNPML